MKYLYKIVLFSVLLLGFNACEDNENFEIFPPMSGIMIDNPVDGSSIILNGDNESNPGLTISWRSPALASGTMFTVEAALTGTDFAAPALIGETTANVFRMSVADINDFALDVLGIPAETVAAVEIRVRSGETVSNVVSVQLTPYKIEYTEFYLVGSLTGWDPATSLPMDNVGFNEFSITVDLPDGAAFKFLPTNTGWDGDFGKDPNNDGVLIQEGEQDISGYPAGKYEIYINLNTFTYTVTEVIAPQNLYLVGSLTGWDPATSLPFFNSADNVYTIVINLPDGAEFKFLPTNTGWDGDWGMDPNNASGIIQDGEVNVSGYAGGTYLITVDFNTLSFNLQSLETLNVVGSIVGWDNGAAIPMTQASLGVFSVVLDLPDGAEIKFLPTLGSWDGDWGADPNNAGGIVQDGENNLAGLGSGLQVVTVNFNNMTYTVSSVTSIPDNLYLVGSFRGWSNDGDNPQFTEISDGVFEITQAFSAGDEFKFVPVAGDWGNDWGESQSNPGVVEQNNEKNVSAPGAGTYTITVNFNTGTITVL